MSWTSRVPTKPGEYWNWNGDYDCAPVPMTVSKSGCDDSCFVEMGQLGLTEAVDCDEQGGFWSKIDDWPQLPSKEWTAAELERRDSKILRMADEIRRLRRKPRRSCP